MIGYLEIGFVLLAAIAALGVAANRLRLPPSIILVVAGAGLAMVPGLPRVELVPELVLLLVLPPVIYSAGVSMSWREFRFSLRPIALLAIGCVVFTTCAVCGWQPPRRKSSFACSACNMTGNSHHQRSQSPAVAALV